MLFSCVSTMYEMSVAEHLICINTEGTYRSTVPIYISTCIIPSYLLFKPYPDTLNLGENEAPCCGIRMKHFQILVVTYVYHGKHF